MFSLSTLGPVDLLDRTDGHQVLSVLAQPKRVGFLTYLAVASPRGMHRRDTLLSVFWPDSSDKRGRNALNQTVFVLRRALGQEVLRVNGEAGIGIDPEHLRCDVWEFEDALERGEKEDALDLFHGNFLDGFFLPGCLDFERWVDAERARLRDLAIGSVLSLSRQMEERGNPVGAVGWLRRARGWAPFDELVLRRQVELLLTLGDRSGAVREYEAFARRLSVDLGMEPSADLRRLLDRNDPGAGTWQVIDEGKGFGNATGSTGEHASRDERHRLTRSQTALYVLMAAAMGVGGGILGPRLWSPATSSESLAEPDGNSTSDLRTVVVLPLENTTARPELDDIGELAASEIARELSSVGLFFVGSPGETLDEMDRDSSPGTQPDQGDVPSSRDASFVITGSYSEVGGQLVFWPRVFDAEAGTIAVRIDTVMGAVTATDEATDRLKHRVSGAMAMAVHPWLSELSLLTSLPPSYEAYLALARGIEHGRNPSAYGYETDRERLDSMNAAFFRAASFDSRFTLPLVMLHYWPWNWEGREEHFRSLQGRREELPRWERAALDFQVARGSGNREGLYMAAGELVRMNPSPDRIRVLAMACLDTNRPREALELLERLDTNQGWEDTWPSYWSYRAMAHQRLGEHEAALEVVDRGRGALGPDAILGRIEVLSLVRLGRVQEAEDRAIEILESARETVFPARLANITEIFWLDGLKEAADRVIPVALNRLAQRGIVDGIDLARILAHAGRYEEARRLLGHPDDLRSQGPEAVGPLRLLAKMAAREGDTEAANRLALTAATVNMESNRTQPGLGTMIRAEVAALLGDRAQAVRLIREAYDAGMVHLSREYTLSFDFGSLQGYQPFEDLMRPKG